MKRFNIVLLMIVLCLFLTACIPTTRDTKSPTPTPLPTRTRVVEINPTTTEIGAKITTTPSLELPTKTSRPQPSPSSPVTSTLRPAATSIPTSTDIPLIPLESLTDARLPLSWPVPVPNETQVAEVRACAIETLTAERYPSRLSMTELPGAYTLETACDWAVLAAAYAERSGDSPHPDGEKAFAQAITMNPAFALTLPILIPYSVVKDTVTAPPFSEQPLTEVHLIYDWDGLGDTASFDITLTDTEDGVTATGTLNNTLFSSTLSTNNWHAMGANLGDLFPITRSLIMIVCYDNYPEWDITLTYADGTQVNLTTNGSNVFNAGGPWQVTIEGQRYMQYSADFLIALLNVLSELELPLGEPAAMFCGGFEEDPINSLFP